jgi:hypothetical protein
MQIAQKHIVSGVLEVGEGLLKSAGAVDAQSLGRKAFLEKRAEAFFIVENKQMAVFQKFNRRAGILR